MPAPAVSSQVRRKIAPALRRSGQEGADGAAEPLKIALVPAQQQPVAGADRQQVEESGADRQQDDRPGEAPRRIAQVALAPQRRRPAGRHHRHEEAGEAVAAQQGEGGPGPEGAERMAGAWRGAADLAGFEGDQAEGEEDARDGEGDGAGELEVAVHSVVRSSDRPVVRSSRNSLPRSDRPVVRSSGRPRIPQGMHGAMIGTTGRPDRGNADDRTGAMTPCQARPPTYVPRPICDRPVGRQEACYGTQDGHRVDPEWSRLHR